MQGNIHDRSTDHQNLERGELVRLNFKPGVDITDYIDATQSHRNKFRDGNAVFYGLVIEEYKHSGKVGGPKFLIIVGVDQTTQIGNEFLLGASEITSFLNALPGQSKDQKHIVLNRTLKFDPRIFVSKAFFATRGPKDATDKVFAIYRRCLFEEDKQRLGPLERSRRSISRFLVEDAADQIQQELEVILSEDDKILLQYQKTQLDQLTNDIKGIPMSTDCLARLIDRAKNDHAVCAGALKQELERHKPSTAFELVSRMKNDSKPVQAGKVSPNIQLDHRQKLIDFMVTMVQEHKSRSTKRGQKPRITGKLSLSAAA